MLNSIYIWSAAFAIIVYMCIVDQNVLQFINILSKQFVINCRRFYWIIRFHPKNPITNFIAHRKSIKMAEQMMKDLDLDK